MFGRILITALIAGSISGAALTALQTYKIMPLIWKAEAFEQKHPGENHVHKNSSKGDAVNIMHNGFNKFHWQSLAAFERLTFTLLTNILTAIGFALLLCASFAIYGKTNWRDGLIWGFFGFIIFHLAPSFGLPPELPGMKSSPVNERQIWWVATVILTAAGFTCVIFSKSQLRKLSGVGLIILPQIYGAPVSNFNDAGPIPAELAAAFVSSSLVTNLIFWALLGAISSYEFERRSNKSLTS